MKNMVTTSADRFGKVKPMKPTVSDGRKNRFRTKGSQRSKKEEEKVKEQEDASNKCSGNCRHGSELLDDKVICEILCKLPVRSLVRFKYVCKPWQLFIEKDPYFLSLHLAHSKTQPKFFAVVERPYGRALLVTADYLCSNKGSGTAAVDIHHNIRQIYLPYSASTKVKYFGSLDGLVGFYDHYRYRGIRLSNVCTQETTPWITSTFVTKFKPKRSVCLTLANCQLGFDPDIKRHKVICIGCIEYDCFQPPCDMFCEVLTVGDNEWRIVEGIPSSPVFRSPQMWNSVYLNGSIYYNTFSFMKSGHLDNDKIVVFDVASEKFRAIAIPDFILYHPRDIDDAIGDPVNLLEVDGRLAISCRINCFVVKLWLYYDEDDDGFRSKNSWREIIVALPFVWDRDRRLTFLSGGTKNEIIIKSAQRFAGEPAKICSLSYHSYNWKKKTFMDIKMNGIPSKFGHLFNSIHSDAIFRESLFPVQ